MKHTIITLILSCLLLSACTMQPLQNNTGDDNLANTNQTSEPSDPFFYVFDLEQEQPGGTNEHGGTFTLISDFELALSVESTTSMLVSIDSELLRIKTTPDAGGGGFDSEPEWNMFNGSLGTIFRVGSSSGSYYTDFYSTKDCNDYGDVVACGTDYLKVGDSIVQITCLSDDVQSCDLIVSQLEYESP